MRRRAPSLRPRTLSEPRAGLARTPGGTACRLVDGSPIEGYQAAMTATPPRPPSTSTTVPLTNCDSSEARYTAACAIASGGPNVPYGVPFIIAAAGSSSIGVRTTPGEIALTRTPGDPNSAAQARVRVSIAPFVDAYSAFVGTPSRATHEPRLMIDPDPRAVISGAIAAVRKNGALTLTA